MKLNTDLLLQLVEAELSDIKSESHVDSTVLIGEVGGVQIHLTVTKDEWNFIESGSSEFAQIVEDN